MKNSFKVMDWIAVMAGGSAGTGLRYGLTLWLPYSVTGIPWPTWVANVSGSFILGLWSGWLHQRSSSSWLKAGVGAGFCGGYTTMSTLAMELAGREGVSLWITGTYAIGSIVAGLAAVWIGWAFGDRLGKRKKEGVTWESSGQSSPEER